MLPVFFGALTTTICPAITPVNVSLATVPLGYFGGNAAHRGDANIEMLAKMRLVMIEKWEGHCWQDCLAQGVGSPPCQAGCDVESIITGTLRRVKAINPGVSGVLYLNTLLAFPFYRLNGEYEAADALTIDSSTGKPIVIRNDNGMEGIFVFGFDKPIGQKLYIDAVKNLTATGVVDGFFGDKWNSQAKPKKDGTGWEICNHECGNVTAAQGKAWNEGKAKTLLATTAHVGDGPYYGNGDVFTGAPEIANVTCNLNGKWGGDGDLKSGDPRNFVAAVSKCLATHKYCFFNTQGDQHWTVDPNDPASIQSKCTGDCLARFLLGVEEGAILGTEGWDESYANPLGNPLAPALYTPQSASAPATLTREFQSGTKVIFTYSNRTDPEGKASGTGEVWWGGVKPRPPPPPPPPPTIECGSSRSTLLNDTAFAGGEVPGKKDAMASSATGCCVACAKDRVCTQWAWHPEAQGKWPSNTCHHHTAKSTQRHVKGAVSGVMER